MLIGEDSSHWEWDDPFDPSKDFYYFKATDGVYGEIDSPKGVTVANMIAKAEDAGKPWGLYHFFYFDQDPIIQARVFAPYARKSKLPPWYDFEHYGPNKTSPMRGAPLVASAESFLVNVEQMAGRRCAIYTNADTWTARMMTGWPRKPPAWTGRYLLAVASYRLTPVLPPGWSEWWMWQYRKDPDYNRFDGTAEELGQYATGPARTIPERVTALEEWARGQGYGG